MQLVARVRRRAWLNGQLIEDVVTDDVDEEEAEALAAADEDGDEGGDWEADVLDDDVRGAGAGGLVGCCRCVEQSWGEAFRRRQRQTGMRPCKPWAAPCPASCWEASKLLTCLHPCHSLWPPAAAGWRHRPAGHEC